VIDGFAIGHQGAILKARLATEEAAKEEEHNHEEL